MRSVPLKVLLTAGLALGLFVLPRAASAQQALVYCPINLDRTGCDAIVTALTGGNAYPGGVDRGYDGTGGTVDLRSADLFAYSVFVVPSLADDSTGKPYAFLRDSLVVEHLRAALIGGIAAWSGTPDQGTTNRAEKDQLIQNLAQWAGASYAAAHGPGLVALLDLSENQDARYDWLRAITPAQLTSDLEVVAYDSVRALTPTATAILAAGNGSLAYASMAALGLATPAATAGLSLDAVGATGTAKGGQVVLATLPAGNTSTAALATDKRDYAPGTTVTITGTGWTAGETLPIELVDDPLIDTHPVLTAVADQNGNWTNTQFSPDEHDISVRFIVTATGGTSGMRAQTTFTDAGDAADGFGTMTVSPTSAVAGQSLPAVTFTFAVPAGGSKTYNDNSTVSIVVPSGWSTPQKTSSTGPGFVRITSSTCPSGQPSVSGGTPAGTLSIAISGNTITVTHSCDAGNQFVLTYNTVTAAPASLTPYEFTTSTHNSANGGTGAPITASGAVQPAISVRTYASSTTTLTAVPASPQPYATSVTFTATVANQGITPTGTIQFNDGATPLGSPVTVSGGSAQLTTSALSVATHTITAVYSGDVNYPASTSSSLSYTITIAQAADGAGTMTVSPATVDIGQTVTLMTFTFAVPVNYDFADSSKVNITVPAGWSAPQKSSSGSSGYVQVSSSNNTCPSGAPASAGNSITISGNTITVVHSCDSGDQFRLTYANATAQATVGTSTFTVSTDNKGVSGGAVEIAVQPTVTVTRHVGSVSVDAQTPTPVTAGGSATYLITVNRDGGTGSFSASLSATGLPAGATASFSSSTVSFSSSNTSRTSTLTITTSGSTPAATTSFTVQATNTIAAADFVTATGSLTVVCVPAITTQPANQAVAVGQAATFSVGAIGGTPLNYQWRKGGAPISGATASSYTIASVTNSDAASYDVVVSNTCGSVTSNAASLAINQSGNVGAVIVDAQTPTPVISGSSATYPVTVYRGVASSGQFDAVLSITTSLPAGATYSFSGLNGQGQLHFGNGANSMTTTLTIATTGT